MLMEIGNMPYPLTRGDQHWELELEFIYVPITPAQIYGPPELCEPAHGGEILTLEAFDDQNNPFDFTPSEIEEALAWIEHNYNFSRDHTNYN